MDFELIKTVKIDKVTYKVESYTKSFVKLENILKEYNINDVVKELNFEKKEFFNNYPDCKLVHIYRKVTEKVDFELLSLEKNKKLILFYYNEDIKCFLF